jgi:hypothetical protein
VYDKGRIRRVGSPRNDITCSRARVSLYGLHAPNLVIGRCTEQISPRITSSTISASRWTAAADPNGDTKNLQFFPAGGCSAKR